MKSVLVVLPNGWDVKQLAASEASWRDRYRPIVDTIEDATLWFDFDPIAHAERLIAEHRGIDGVFSSSDYPGAVVAAAIATRLELPGSTPQAVLRAGHKYHSRMEQAIAAPVATPAFELIDPANLRMPSFGFPCFVKPVKGAFSMFARRIDSEEELRAFLAQPDVREYADFYLSMFDRMIAHYTDLPHGRGWCIAEELLSGMQVTVEGFVHRGRVEVFGIVDSIMYPGTKSFARFELPSSLPREVQERMSDVVRRVIARLGLGDGLFNAEMIWDPTKDRVFIIEINPRLCGQFGDLHLRVHGKSTYELALDLASGSTPTWTPGNGKFSCAASHPLRIFEPMSVVRAPASDEVREAEAEHEVLIWNECAAGDRLTDFISEDGASRRYAVINAGGRDPADRDARVERVRAQLGWSFEPIGPSLR